jgi:ribosome-binding protein aMBF1 (putative translation factor)
MSNNINTQDWTTVTFSKHKTQPKKTNIKYTQAKLKIDEDGNEYKKLYKLSSDEIKEYTKYRLDIKLTRKDLAKKICCLQSDIDCLENGKISNSTTGGKYKSFLKREYSKVHPVLELDILSQIK